VQEFIFGSPFIKQCTSARALSFSKSKYNQSKDAVLTDGRANQSSRSSLEKLINSPPGKKGVNHERKKPNELTCKGDSMATTGVAADRVVAE
jgi:hypothetical protein